MRLTDDDAILQDSNGATNDPATHRDAGDPQVLTSPVIGTSGNTIANAGTNVYALGSGTFRIAGDPNTYTYMMIGSTSSPSASWGFVVNVEIPPGAVVTLGAINYLSNRLPYADINHPLCFTAGTLIETLKGSVAIEELRRGDMILTQDGSYAPIQWIGSSKVSVEAIRKNPKLAPVLISAGALGVNYPQRDLRVSRQHRMLVSSPLVKEATNREAVLIAAIKLTELPGIYVEEVSEGVEYFHMLFDRHTVVLSEGAYSESLYLGPEALKSISPEALEEVTALFPDIIDRVTASEEGYVIPSLKEQKKIVALHKSESSYVYQN